MVGCLSDIHESQALNNHYTVEPPVVSALWRWKQKSQKFKVIFSYTRRSIFKVDFNHSWELRELASFLEFLRDILRADCSVLDGGMRVPNGSRRRWVL